jgi:ribose transport system substrate-binding protein
MKKTWRILSIVIAVLLIVSLAACGKKGTEPAGKEETKAPATESKTEEPKKEEPAEEKQFTFGYIAWKMTDEWNQYGEEAFQWAAKQKGVKVISVDGEGDPAKQVLVAEDLINQGVDAISLFPLTPEVGATIVRMCNDANIPISIENIFLPEGSGEVIGQVACRYDDIGYAAIKYAAEKYPGCKMLYCAGAIGMGVYEEYQKGVDRAMEEFGDKVTMVGRVHGDWETEKSMQVVQDFISSGKSDFDVVFANNDLQARGVYNALKEANLDGKVKIISTGGAPVGFDMIREGTATANMTAPVNIQGLITFRNCWQAVNGVKIEEPIIPLPIIPVDIDNIDTDSVGWEDHEAAFKYVGEITP